MLTVNLNRKYIFSLLILSAFICSSFYSAAVAAKDLTPPYLVNPIPEPGTVTNNWYFIRTGIIDQLTGVDEASVTVDINGAPPRVKPIIEQSFEGKGCYVTVILDSTEKSETVFVEITALDEAEEPNLMKEGWSFTVDAVSSDKYLINTFPENNRNLAYSTELGKLNFSWVSMDNHEFYRIEFLLKDGSTGTVDFSRETLEASYNSVTFSVDVQEKDWNILTDIGPVGWRVAPLDQPLGNTTMDYSKTSYVTYVPDSLPVLQNPYHNAMLDTIHPPTFIWNSLDCATEGYSIVFVRLENGTFTSDVKVFETPLYIRTLPMQELTWNDFNSGEWAWTVLGRQGNGQFSDYMIQRFRKE